MTSCDFVDDLADEEYEKHLADIPDGSGCTEIWEHLSERRENGDDSDDG